jgi:hypothetical protein
MITAIYKGEPGVIRIGTRPILPGDIIAEPEPGDLCLRSDFEIQHSAPNKPKKLKKETPQGDPEE